MQQSQHRVDEYSEVYKPGKCSISLELYGTSKDGKKRLPVNDKDSSCVTSVFILECRYYFNDQNKSRFS